ncbi:BglG family transcription antiterminator [Streptococcus dentiloxodontae]
MLNKKEKRIVQILMAKKDKFVTSRELAAQLNCSDRTIRTYYKSLLEELKDYTGVAIISKQGHGYKLVVSDEDRLRDLLSDNNIADKQLNYITPLDNIDRHSYLLNKLLFEQNKIYFDDLADELYVSRSTLSSDFRKIRKEFAPYHLKVESKANRGVYVTGSERDKRRFIMDYFVTSGFIHTIHSYVESEFLNSTISFEELTIIVLDECREGNLKLSDFVIQNLVVHIALAIRRIAEGFQITKVTDTINLNQSHEREVARKILERVSLSTKIDFPVEEIDYITLHLLSKGHGGSDLISERFIDGIRTELLQAIELLAPEFGKDFQLTEGLVAHLSTLLIRLESRIILENPMTDDIVQNYKEMYHLAEKVMSHLSAFSSFYLSQDEIAYIALHFMAAQERYKEQNKYNILVICATGYGSAQMLKSRIENELGNLVHIVDVIGYYDISDDKLKGIDFIVSSIDLSNLIFTVPVVTVSVFLTDEELKTIKNKLIHLNKCQKQVLLGEPKNKNTKGSSEENFNHYFSENAFLLLSTGSKEVVLQQLVHSISAEENQEFEKRMLQLIEQREAMSSVVFSDTIAVPHPIKAIGNNHHIAVAIIKNGLYWNQKFPAIKLVFLTSMSIYENDGLPDLASAIVDLVDQSDLQHAMIACQSFDQFRELFLNIKER